MLNRLHHASNIRLALLIFLSILVFLLFFIKLTKNEQIVKNDFTYHIKHDGLIRKYRVHIARNINNELFVPVVIYLHGGGGGLDSSRKDGMYDKSDKYGFMLVSPGGTGAFFSERWLTWNSGEWITASGKKEKGFGYAAINNIDDVGFISKVIDDLKFRFNVDSKRIYVTGISNGGSMSYRLACELSDKIAAVAVVAPPATPSNCNPQRPISIMQIHGTADPCAPYYGGRGGGCLGSKKYEMQSSEFILNFWRKQNNCSSATISTYKNGQASCISNSYCADNSEVLFCSILNGGHTWPSGQQYLPEEKIGQVSYDISFDQMWDFFQSHMLP